MTPAAIIAWHEEKLAGLRAMEPTLALASAAPPSKERDTTRGALAAARIMIACHEEALEFLRAPEVLPWAVSRSVYAGGLPA